MYFSVYNQFCKLHPRYVSEDSTEWPVSSLLQNSPCKYIVIYFEIVRFKFFDDLKNRYPKWESFFSCMIKYVNIYIYTYLAGISNF